MKNSFFLILIVFLLGGCTLRPPAKIPVEIPREKTVVVVPQKGTAINKNRQVYADPTRGIIDNLSQEVIKIWFNQKAGKPNLILRAGEISGDIYLPLGYHRIYIERWSWTRYGPQFREETIVQIEIGQFFPVAGENYGWQIQIRNDWISTPEGNYYFY